MSGRRGFLALVGGAFVTGSIRDVHAARPTLLVPAGLVTPLPRTGVVRSRHPVIDFGRVLDGVPDDLFQDWLEGGLRMVEGCKPGGNIHRAALTEGRDVAAEVNQSRAEYSRRKADFLRELGLDLADQVRIGAT